MYASFTPAFYFASDGTPTGGFFRDGRAASLIDQAQLPFLNQFEMANPSAADVQQRLQSRPYYAQFVQVFGSAGTADATMTLASVGAALAAYEAEGPEFRPFSSKFDAYTNGQTTLTADELQGMALFNDPSKGNCTACHISTPVGGVPALFTDFTYDNVGIPRNWQIAANAENTTLPYVPANGTALGADYRYYDMGLCGPQRTTYSSLTQLCGMFKVPTLRNVAIKQHYFHNGVFDNLSDVVSWYITRDTNPTHWYVKADGVTVDVPYNDLPTIYDANVNIVEVPYNPGVAPTLTPAEMNQIVNFLCTLTDGYDPSNPAAYRQQPQCIKAAAGGLN
jgi:cytochrome c peroxidase